MAKVGWLWWDLKNSYFIQCLPEFFRAAAGDDPYKSSLKWDGMRPLVGDLLRPPDMSMGDGMGYPPPSSSCIWKMAGTKYVRHALAKNYFRQALDRWGFEWIRINFWHSIPPGVRPCPCLATRSPMSVVPMSTSPTSINPFKTGR
jgi:hypothetical protein